jgi:tRNA modification GTPase
MVIFLFEIRRNPCYNQIMKTIVGIATPIGFGGIGIVRLSGQNALQILSKMFTPHLKITQIIPRRATLGTVYGETASGNKYTDTAIAIFFPAPHSFTGEDVVEIQAHGGYKLLQEIMRTAIKHGAVPATNGEFTKTAFLNGKMSIEQAESIIDIINAESGAEISNAGQIMSGALRSKLNSIETALISVRANIDAYLDYPDELPAEPEYRKDIAKITAKIDDLLSTAKTGQIIKNGISVAIIGKPNVGKSSLFNAILNENRSIVTEIAGTTTDTVAEQITHKGIKIKFLDTAGIRDGQNIIETAGIQRTVETAAKADIVLVVLDASTELNAYDRQCINIAMGQIPLVIYNNADESHRTDAAAISARTKALVVCNKTDLTSPSHTTAYISAMPDLSYPLSPSHIAEINFPITNPTKNTHTAPQIPPYIPVSAKNGKNIDKVLDGIVALAVESPPSGGTLVITNERHERELTAAKTALQSAAAADALDKAATDITAALDHIGAITGTNITEATLDEIFSQFCLGK